MLFEKVYLLGVGLIGGSLALELKGRGLAGKIIGYDTDKSNLEMALDMGILDEASAMDQGGLEGCGLVVLAIPVFTMDRILEKGFMPGTLVTDVGSVKGSSVKAYRRALADGKQYRFVPAHPIAGDERSGPEAARCGLFKGARVVITPLGEPGPDEESVKRMWESVGANVQYMDPFKHDSVFAWVSHMPHMAAYAIIDSILAEDPGLVNMSGGGLRDYTRIAASSPRMWAEIAVENMEQLLIATQGLRGAIDRIIAALERGDGKELEMIFERIAAVRRSIN
jgi:prephenate dehydrogenase